MDHVPPRGFFPKIPKGNLITVPAHKDCNGKFSRDDELFRDISVLTSGNKKAHELLKEPIKRSWEKSPGKKINLRSKLSDILERTKISEATIYFETISFDNSPKKISESFNFK